MFFDRNESVAALFTLPSSWPPAVAFCFLFFFAFFCCFGLRRFCFWPPAVVFCFLFFVFFFAFFSLKTKRAVNCGGRTVGVMLSNID